ncbi:MAG: hypothetical protein LBR26_00065 [Prevotella sp.]|jgi:hypothetical protein|nr:hypothetical protein [Prevotella sp.]
MILHKFGTATPVLALAGLALLGSCTRDEEASAAASSIQGIESAEKFTSSLIKTTKVTFRLGVDLKEMLNNLKFERRIRHY